MKTEILTACEQLVSAAINGTAYGILLTVFVACGLRAMGGVNAATRHALWFFTLILLAALVPAQLWRGGLVSVQRAEVDASREKLANKVADLPLGSRADSQTGISHAPAGFQRVDERSSSPPPDESTGQQFAPSELPDERLAEHPRSRVDRFLSPGSWNLDLGSAVPQWTGASLAAIWLAVAAIRMALLLWRVHGVRKLKKSALPPTPELNELFRRLRAKLVMTRNVELRVSHAQRSAIVLGFFHPAILFPIDEGQAADLEAAEHVLGHELAHVQRFDDWANLIQHFVQAALFFHPAVWWVSKQLALEREIACDDFVLHQGGRPREYALLLVNLASRGKGREPALAPGVSTGKCQLKQRINMILNAHRNTSPCLAKAKLGFITTATTLVALLALCAAPRLVLAENTATDAAADNLEVSSVSALAAAPQLAQADPPPAPGPAVVDEGPKFKDGELPSEDVLPSPAPRREPRKPRAAATPRPPRPPGPEDPGSSIEERLDRLERMVQSLAARQKASLASPNVTASIYSHPTPRSDPNALIESKAVVKRETARAAEMAKRAAKQAEKAVKMEGKSREATAMRGAVQAQLQALNEARETLQREMEKLERQIEQIQRAHERTLDEKLLRELGERDERQEGEPKTKW